MDSLEFQIYETTHWRVILLDEQRYLGRSVVVLKRECGDLAEIAEDEVKDLFTIIPRMQDLLRKTFGARMFNWACNMNDAFQTNPPQPQVHWHFIPRYDHEVLFAGEVFKDVNFGHHHLKGGEGDCIISPELRTMILEKLKKNLDI